MRFGNGFFISDIIFVCSKARDLESLFFSEIARARTGAMWQLVGSY